MARHDGPDPDHHRPPLRRRTAAAEERPEPWRLMVERWPAYEDYRRKASREIPVVVLERS